MNLDKPLTRWEHYFSNFITVMIIIIIVFTMDSFMSTGKRYTYCDHLRHVKIDHNVIIELPEECKIDDTDVLRFFLSN